MQNKSSMQNKSRYPKKYWEDFDWTTTKTVKEIAAEHGKSEETIYNYLWRCASEEAKEARKAEKDLTQRAVFDGVVWNDESDYAISKRLNVSYYIVRKYRAILAPETLSESERKKLLEKAAADEARKAKQPANFFQKKDEAKRKAAEAAEEFDKKCRSLDWRAPIAKNAAILGVCIQTISKLRKKYAPETVNDYGMTRRRADLQDKYANVDWAKMTNIQIAKITGDKPMRVSLNRKRLAPETVRSYKQRPKKSKKKVIEK